jgi:hypothetical protein
MLWHALEKYGVAFIIWSLLGLVCLMLFPLYLPADTESQISIAADLTAVIATGCFLWLQLFVRRLFEMWATREHPGMLSKGEIKFLLLLNTSVIIMALSASLALITFDLAMKYGIYNPFEVKFTKVQSHWFFLDQAFKGLLFDVSNVFDLHLQSELRADAWRHPLFGLVLVAYRLVMAYLTITLIVPSWRRWVGD